MTGSTTPPHWQENLGNIAAALHRSGDTHAVADVLDILQHNDNAYWISTPDSFLLSEIIDHPRKRIMNWALAGGKLDDMLRFEQAMSIFALRAGCHEAHVQGRAGWERVLPGYSRSSVWLRKTLR
jgi:hypothetical protein